MNDKRPVNATDLADNDVLGENFKLLIQYEAFDEIISDEDEEEMEEKLK